MTRWAESASDRATVARQIRHLAIIGAITLLIGAALVASTLVRGFAAPAYAASTPYELYCPGTPVGNIALNDVVTDGTITPASPASGQEFNLTGYQSVVNLPSSIVSAAAALGNSAITGTAVLKVDATGATPATVSAGTVPIDVPIPSPVPAVGLTLDLPSAPGTVGPFTAAGGPVTLSVDRSISLTISVSGSNLNLTCTPYANNSDPTGIASSAPSGSPISPVIATANGGTTPSTTTSEPGSTSTAPGSGTSPYELYCPGTPVGNIVLNDVVTDGTITPASPASGQQFSLTGFQSVLNLPSLIVSAAAALGNSAITGTAVVKVDATGATPASLSAGTVSIDAPIPSPVPAAGLTLDLPSPPGTVGPFTATGGTVSLTVDRAINLTISVSGSNLNLTCTAYPDNTAPSGITSAAPSGSPASPVIATATSGGPPPTTTSTSTSTSTTATHTATAAGSTTTTTVAPGPPLALSTGSAPIQAGGTVTVTGSGFQPGEPVAFAVFSARVDVGTADADAEGDVTKAVTIPASLPSGTHTITATGETSGVVDTVSITVSAVSTSSTTGAPTTSSTTRAVPATTGVTPAVPSRALAFTGPGAPLRWLALAGALLVVLAGALCLAMAARRAVVLVVAPGASPPVSLRRRAAEFGALRAREARTVADWLLGRRR